MSGMPSSPPRITLDYARDLIDDRFLALNSKTDAEVRLERERLAYLISSYRPPIARDLSIAKPPALRL
ncbi:MAG: hypothetical protein ACAH82_09905 [Solirubrobacteraceae bacterium]